MASDPDKAAVYLCEDRLSRLAEAGTAVQVGTRLVAVEAEHTFTTVAAAALFCTLTCAEMGLPPVTVRLRRGERESHYDPARAEIALASWGARRLVIVHELAHHLDHCQRVGVGNDAAPGHGETPGQGAAPVHGRSFRDAMLALLRHLGLTRQAAELARLYGEAGLDLSEVRQ